MSNPSRRPSFAPLLLFGWLLVAVELLVLYWGGTAETLLDTDDAMRLVQARAFLAGQGWFDLTEMRVAPPGGYESHWSRLIDAGLAGLFMLFRLGVDDSLAERLMRTVWPLLWLLPAMAGAAAIAWRMAGRDAATVTLTLAVIGLPALQQFKPGSIDHHNVQIALAVLTVAATVWSDRVQWAAWAAGGLTGLALAIGLESLPYLALCGAAFALRFICDRDAADALGAYGAALAASTLAAFLASVAPDQWGRSVCDAIAINLAAPVAAGGALLAVIARRYVDERTPARCAAMAAIAGVVLALFVVLEPRCLSGPFALMDAAVRPIWLARVEEMQPLIAFAREAPVRAAAIVAFPLAALLSACVLAGEASLRRDFGFLTAAAVFAAAAVTTAAAIKAYNYPMWLGMPFVAAMVPRLCAALKLETASARLVAAVFLTPTMLSTGAVALAQAGGAQADGRRAAESACLRTAAYAPLAHLPAGLVAAEVDFGPFVLALTPHSVLAAPYHRLSAGVIAAHQAFALPPDEARLVLVRAGATYLLTCGSRQRTGSTEGKIAASLARRLQSGAIPDWLEKLPQASAQAFAVYRISY